MKKFYNFIKENLIIGIALICFCIFLCLIIAVTKNDVISIDTIFYNILSKYIIRDSITPIAKVFTFLGSTVFFIGLLIAVLILVKNKKSKIMISSNLICVAGLNQILKRIIRRPRPTEFRLIEEKGYSFPSGHSMVSMAFYGLVIYLIYSSNIKNKYLKWLLMILLSIQIILIGISRIYLGVHYTSDVLAGFILAIFYLILFIKGTNKYFEK